MDTIPRYVFLGLVVVVLGAMGVIHIYTTRSAPNAPLKGAGSTFVAPLMVQWSHRYERTEDGCRIGYSSVGSGAGIKQLVAGTTGFACSEAPLTDEQMEKAQAKGGAVVHIPLVLGAVVPVYNLPGVKQPLRFTGPLLADIFLGKVKRWDDQSVQDLNPGIELPKEEMKIVHRSDSSGTTFVWSDYLSKASKEWKEKAGASTDLKWPTGTGESGNRGVANKVRDTPYSIGYAELTSAYRADLAFGLVRNREGEFVKAGLPAVEAAAEALVDIPEDLRFSLTDAPGKGSYPICGTTWAIVRFRQDGHGKQLADFLSWAVSDGQDAMGGLFYSRLPERLRERARKQVARIER
jgi:phosphate transport system substrate-binding protein